MSFFFRFSFFFDFFVGRRRQRAFQCDARRKGGKLHEFASLREAGFLHAPPSMYGAAVYDMQIRVSVRIARNLGKTGFLKKIHVIESSGGLHGYRIPASRALTSLNDVVLKMDGGAIACNKVSAKNESVGDR